MIRSSLARLASGLHHGVWLTRAVTLGVRAVVVGQPGIFLVRHTYVAGWYLPGGGVERGETAEAAIVRELAEEGGLRCLGRPELHGFFRHGRHDHVACYVVRAFEAGAAPRHSWEIAEAGWFPPDALPDGTTAATRARIAEVTQRRRPPADWSAADAAC